MNLLSLVLSAAEDTETTKTAASPGIMGWVFTFLMAIAVAYLIYDMVNRIRKVRYREEVRAEISEEEAALDEARELARERAEREKKNQK
jgi:Na+-transporting methylmalonyl-CoA/oxaloacetate decarboxylase gamma subunit